MSIQEHLNKIRNAVFGSEVRESIAKGIETAYNDASEKDNANMEVKMARGTHPNLNSRLEEVDNKQQQTTAQLAQTEQELNARVSETIANAGDGTLPTEVVDMRTVGGRTYTVAGDALRALSEGKALKRDSVTPTKIPTKHNLIDDATIHEAKVLTGRTTTEPYQVALGNNASYIVAELILPKRGTLEIYTPDLDSGQAVVFEDIDGNALFQFIARAHVKDVGRRIGGYIEVFSGYYTIDIDALREQHPNVHKVFLGFRDVEKDVAYAYGIKNVKLKDFEWLDIEWLAKTGEEEPSNKLITPTVYPIVEGDTGYIYLDNVLYNGNYYKGVNVGGDGARTPVGAFEYPSITSSTNTTINLLSDNDETLLSETIPVKVVPKSVGSGKNVKVMVFGESTTASSDFLNHFASRLENDEMEVELVGTRTNPDGIKHEGRSGFSLGMMRYLSEYNNITNAFFNPSKNEFDYGYYREQNPDIPIPDYVFLNFGINSLSKQITGHGDESYIDYLDFITSNMRSVSPDIKFIFGLSTGISRWENYNRSSNLRLRKTILDQNEDVIKMFGKRESEGFFLAPIYLNVDMVHDMKNDEKPVNLYSIEKTRYGTDMVHPAKSGYEKAGDVCYWALKYAVSKE